MEKSHQLNASSSSPVVFSSIHSFDALASWLTELVGVKRDLSPLGGEGNFRLNDPVVFKKAGFDGVDAGGAGHPFDLFGERETETKITIFKFSSFFTRKDLRSGG